MKPFAFAPDYVGGPALAQWQNDCYVFGDGDWYAKHEIESACNIGGTVHYLTWAELEAILAKHFAVPADAA